jgi:hypothetical protein
MAGLIDKAFNVREFALLKRSPFASLVCGNLYVSAAVWMMQMVDHGSLPPVLHKPDGRATDNQCVFNMINGNLAIGLLGIPYCFKSCGIILTVLLMVRACAREMYGRDRLLA